MRHSRNDILNENKQIDCKITSKNTLCVLHIQSFSRCDTDYKITSKNTPSVPHREVSEGKADV